MRRLIRPVGYALATIVVGLLFLSVVTARRGDARLWPPSAGAPSIEIFVVSHGYHAGLALPTAQVASIAGREGHDALIAVTQRFSSFPFVEIGWGDQGFYTQVPDAASLTIAHALRALFLPGNSSVLHVVGLPDHPRKVFGSSDIVSIQVGEDGFARMIRTIDASFARTGQPPALQVLGQGLYGPSLFYRAVENFHLFNVCNHWVARQLSAAGVATAPVVATLPAGLLFDLKWRSGLSPMPREIKEQP